MQLDRMQCRRAIEALRAGVPNRDAVRALGASQPKLEERYRHQMEACCSGSLPPCATDSNGTIFIGGFGKGKSHLLERFQEVAREQNFVCSKVVISKETPFHDLGKVYRSAIESAVLPDRVESCMYALGEKLAESVNSPKYVDFFKWVTSPESRLCHQFAATVHIYEAAKGWGEVGEAIVAFWSGDPMRVPDLRHELKNYGLGALYKIRSVPKRELAEQRFAFAPRLMRAAGYAGWVVLFDEAELIGSYGRRSRALSYAMLPRYLGADHSRAWDGITSVVAMTDEFVAAVLETRKDEEVIPYKYGGEPDLVHQAEAGMKLIRGALVLEPTTEDGLKQIWEKIRVVYASAYDWSTPDEYSFPQAGDTIRQTIKKWITEWDLARLYDHKGEVDITKLTPKLEENPEIELPGEGVSDGEGETG